MATTWQKIYQETIDKGFSKDTAYRHATDTMNTRRTKYDPTNIIGMRADLAAKEMDENGYRMRVVNIGNPITLDYVKTRYNVNTVKDIVTEIVSIG